MQQAGRCLDHAGDFIGAQNSRQLPWCFRKDQVIIGDVRSNALTVDLVLLGCLAAKSSP
jgi:hypothetical protein